MFDKTSEPEPEDKLSIRECMVLRDFTLLYEESHPIETSDTSELDDSLDLIDWIDLESLLADTKTSDTSPNSSSLKNKSSKFPSVHSNPNISSFVKCVTKTIEGIPHCGVAGSNLSTKHLEALSNLQNNLSLVIKPVDKGGNTVVMDQSDYCRMCMDILNNRDWYSPISETQLDGFKQSVFDLTSLRKWGHLHRNT